jgi:hypothetical protein
MLNLDAEAAILTEVFVVLLTQPLPPAEQATTTFLYSLFDSSFKIIGL